MYEIGGHELLPLVKQHSCGAEYTQATVALSEVVDKYFTLDPYDPERATLVKVSHPSDIGTARWKRYPF